MPTATKSKKNQTTTARSGTTTGTATTPTPTMRIPITDTCQESCVATGKRFAVLNNRYAVGVMNELAELPKTGGMSVTTLQQVLRWPIGKIRSACNGLRAQGLIEGKPNNFVITSQGRQFWAGYEKVFPLKE